MLIILDMKYNNHYSINLGLNSNDYYISYRYRRVSMDVDQFKRLTTSTVVDESE